MLRGEVPVPARRSRPADDPDCVRARVAVAEGVAEAEGPDEQAWLREHLLDCDPCNSLYRDKLLAEARLRRTLLRAEDDDDDDEDAEPMPRRRALLSPVAIARAGFGTGGRSRASWVILLAALFYVAIRLTPSPSGAVHAQLVAVAGEVLSNGRPQSAGAAVTELSRGDWVRTPEGSYARLSLGTSEVEIAPFSLLQVEEPAERRLRFEEGEIVLTGPSLVTCAFGIVEVVRGRARLTLDRGRLLAESIEGEVRALNAGVEHVLLPGETVTLAPAL